MKKIMPKRTLSEMLGTPDDSALKRPITGFFPPQSALDHWKILAFYNNDYKNSPLKLGKDRVESIDWLKTASSTEKEKTHCYVQLAFPSCEYSKYSHQDMIVTKKNIDIIRRCLQQPEDGTSSKMRIDVTMQAMLNHWGLAWDTGTKTILIINAANFQRYIVAKKDHNQLRLTRFMSSISLFHPEGIAIVQSLYDTIITSSHYKQVNELSKKFWASCHANIIKTAALTTPSSSTDALPEEIPASSCSFGSS